MQEEIEIPIEERLIQKGIQYKNSLVQKRHELITQQIEVGPTFKPQLVSNNDAYLQKRGIEGTLLETLNLKDMSNATLSQLNRTLLPPGQQHYIKAMVFLMNKQSKIIEHQKLEQLKYGKPEINLHSRQIVASDKNRLPIFERPLFKEGLQGTLHSQKVMLEEVVDEDKKRESRERIREFLARNYQRHMQKINKVKEAEEDDSDEKIFKPQLSEGTMNLIT